MRIACEVAGALDGTPHGDLATTRTARRKAKKKRIGNISHVGKVIDPVVSQRIQPILDAITAHSDEKDAGLQDIYKDIYMSGVSACKSAYALTQASRQCLKLAKLLGKAFTKKQRAIRAEKFTGHRWHSHTSKVIKNVKPAALTHLRRTKDRGKGKPIGGIVLDPAEIDLELHEAWDPIYAGNLADPPPVLVITKP